MPMSSSDKADQGHEAYHPPWLAIEACATRRGTIVGPLTELVGFPSLPPSWRWCGNEIFAGASNEVLQSARDSTVRFGEQLKKEGYRGYLNSFSCRHETRRSG
jgi:hypothetical protein